MTTRTPQATRLALARSLESDANANEAWADQLETHMAGLIAEYRASAASKRNSAEKLLREM